MMWQSLPMTTSSEMTAFGPMSVPSPTDAPAMTTAPAWTLTLAGSSTADGSTNARGWMPGANARVAAAKWRTTTANAREGFSTAIKAVPSGPSVTPRGTMTAAALVWRNWAWYFSLPRKLTSPGPAASSAAMPVRDRSSPPRTMSPSTQRASSESVRTNANWEWVGDPLDHSLPSAGAGTGISGFGSPSAGSDSAGASLLRSFSRPAVMSVASLV